MGLFKDVFTPAEVAEMLMVSPVTVRQWAKRGELKAVTTPGGHRRFLRHELEQFAHERNLVLKLEEWSGLRILIVDDDVQLSGYLEEFLGTCPGIADVAVANDGFSAGTMIYSFKPHLLLLDLMMPGMDGFAVCKQLKSGYTTRNVRVIGMTGFYSDENVERILAAGAEVCLKKPFDKDELMKAIGLEFDESMETFESNKS